MWLIVVVTGFGVNKGVTCKGSILHLFGYRLTITLSSNKQRHSFQPLYIARRDVSGATVVPLSVLVEGINFDSATGVRHPGR